MQALKWPGATSRRAGTASAQAGSATGQRVRKTQPEGGLAGLGTSPLRIWRSALASGSGEGIAEIEKEQAMEAAMAEQALRQFEVELGLVTPETAGVAATEKELGPAKQTETQ